MHRSWQLNVLLAFTLFTAGGATCVQTINTPPLRPGATLEEAAAVASTQTAFLTTLSMPQSRLGGSSDGTAFPSISAKIAVAPPLGMRLVAETPFTGKEVDMGSNADIFWFWVKRNSPPATYFCRHDQFATSAVRSQSAMDASWVLESIGFGVFRPTDQLLDLRPAGEGRLAIRAARPDPLGTMQKVVVIDARVGWILEQHLFDSRQQLVARSLGREHQKDLVTGAVVPGKLEIFWPQTKLQLNVGLGQILFNEPLADPAHLFSLPENSDYPQVDLAELGNGPPPAGR